MAGRKCTVCAHPKREAVDAALIDGGSKRAVAGQFGLKPSAVDRHKAHIGKAVVEAPRAKLAKAGDAAAERIASSHAALDAILARNLEVEDKVAIMALRERREYMAYEKPPVQRVELSEAVRKLTPEQVADELAAAVLEMAAQDAKLGERLRAALAPLLSG